jgi:hypothetical protein
MQMVLIEACKKPASFADVKFTEADWKFADKAGPKKVPMVTAKEAVRNSHGLYVIRLLNQPEEVQQVQLARPEDMSNEALVAEMTAHGKPPRKRMERRTAVDFVKSLREEAAKLIIEDEE